MDIEKSIVYSCTDSESMKIYVRYGIDKEMFADPFFGAMFDYAKEHFVTHGASKEAPTEEIMRFKFAEFPTEGDVASPSYLVEQLKELYAKRCLVGKLRDISPLLQENPLDAAIALQEEIANIIDLSSNTENKIVYGENVELQKQAEESLVDNNFTEGVPYPYKQLTEHTGGIRLGEITILSAPPSCGKSWWCCHNALEAKKKGWNVYFATLEMQPVVMSQRINLIKCGLDVKTVVPTAKYTSGIDVDFYKPYIDKAREEIANMPGKLVIESPQNNTVRGIFSNARQNGCNFVIIDQLQFIARTGNRSRTEQIEQIINEIAQEARNHPSGQKMAVLLISQLNREGVNEQKNGKMASMTNLAMSASLEQIADCVLTLGQTDEEKNLDLMTLVINKGRRFPSIGFQLFWSIKERPLFYITRVLEQW